jgi:glutathione S-transferase
VSLKLYYHPLSSFCHKALISLYEHDVAFEAVDLGDEKSGAEMRSFWPVGKFPVLRDEGRNHTVAEATVIIEYLDIHHVGTRKMVPADSDRAWQARMWDRFFDLYVHVKMQKIVDDHLRPAGAGDQFGIDEARARVLQSYAMIDQAMAGKTWAMGNDYGIVDCAASPALFYANGVLPIDHEMKNLTGYFGRLMARPSYVRALEQAQPYFHLFTMEPKPHLPITPMEKN